MEYKLNIFSLIILIGILGTGFHYGKAGASELMEGQGAFHVSSKNDPLLESFYFAHTVSPLKKCCQSLFFERYKPIGLFRANFFLLISNISPSSSIKPFFGPININAP